MLAEARLELYDAIASAVPAGVHVSAYPIKAGKASRFQSSVTIGFLNAATEDTHQMIEAEIMIEAPATAGIDVAYGQIDLLCVIVGEALPINWLVIERWDIEELSEPVPALHATTYAIGNPSATPEPPEPEYMLIVGTDRALINDTDLGRIR